MRTLLTQHERHLLARAVKAVTLWEVFRETEAYVDRRVKSSSARVPLVADAGNQYWRTALLERGYQEHLVDAAVKYATELIALHNQARTEGKR